MRALTIIPGTLSAARSSVLTAKQRAKNKSRPIVVVVVVVIGKAIYFVARENPGHYDNHDYDNDNDNDNDNENGAIGSP